MPAWDAPLQRLGAALAERVGVGIGVCVQALQGEPEPLFPAEASAVARAVPRRQHEFAWGRTAAREAMRQLGWPVQAVPSGQDRAPVWPAGLVGSISHCSTGCVALVAPRAQVLALGIDMEDAKALDTELWPLLLTVRERAALQALPVHERGMQAMRVFSAKEAFYKWQYPATTTVLEFQDAEIFWEAGADDFSVACDSLKGTPLHRASGRWLSDGQWVVSWVISRSGLGG